MLSTTGSTGYATVNSTVVEGVEHHHSSEWVLASIVSAALDAFINEPLAILVRTFASAARCTCDCHDVGVLAIGS